jgi:hypothetical protein
MALKKFKDQLDFDIQVQHTSLYHLPKISMLARDKSEKIIQYKISQRFYNGWLAS